MKSVQTGEAWKQEFTEGCTKDPDRFEKPIKRRRVKDLVRAAVARKVKVKDAKLLCISGPATYRFIAIASELGI